MSIAMNIIKQTMLDHLYIYCGVLFVYSRLQFLITLTSIDDIFCHLLLNNRTISSSSNKYQKSFCMHLYTFFCLFVCFIKTHAVNLFIVNSRQSKIFIKGELIAVITRAYHSKYYVRNREC